MWTFCVLIDLIPNFKTIGNKIMILKTKRQNATVEALVDSLRIFANASLKTLMTRLKTNQATAAMLLFLIFQTTNVQTQIL